MIERTKDSFVIKLNSGLYDKNSVKDAFKELKKEILSEIKETEGYFVVKIKKTSEAENYGYEFVNYVLKLMKNKGIV